MVAFELTKCFAVQNSYGRQVSDFDIVAATFLEDLEEFEATIISKCLKEWRRLSPNFPTPFDIKTLCEKKLESAYDPVQEEIQRFHAAGFDFVNVSHFNNLNTLFDAVLLAPEDMRKSYAPIARTPASRKGIEWEIKRISKVYPELFKNDGAISEWYNALRHVPYLYLKTAVDIALSGDQKADLKTLTIKVSDIFKTYGA